MLSFLKHKLLFFYLFILFFAYENTMVGSCLPHGLRFCGGVGENSGCDTVNPETGLNLSPENGLSIADVMNQATGRPRKKVALHQINAGIDCQGMLFRRFNAFTNDVGL